MERLHFADPVAFKRHEISMLLDGDLVFCAENLSNEGLDRILSYLPRNGSAPALDTTLYLAAITTAGTVDGTTALDGTHVPNANTIWATDYQTGNAGATRGGGGEPTIGTGSYARKSVANADWGAPATSGSGRRTTCAQESFAQSTAAWSNPNVIGYAIVNNSAAGSGVAYGFSNFSDNSTVAVNASGIVLQVTPFWQHDQ